MYVLAPNQIIKKFPYSINDLKKNNPDTSFPRNPSLEMLASWNVFPVVSTGVQYDPATQVATKEGCEFNTTLNRWETSWTVRDKTQEELDMDFANAKESKRNEIRTDFESVENDPVEVNSLFWNGGYESAQKLDGAKRMAEMLSQTSVTFYDVDNIGHSLTTPEAEVIITTIGIDYQTKFANKQAKMVAIDNATTLEELDGIVW